MQTSSDSAETMTVFVCKVLALFLSLELHVHVCGYSGTSAIQRALEQKKVVRFTNRVSGTAKCVLFLA